jgi:hypothetical protein
MGVEELEKRVVEVMVVVMMCRGVGRRNRWMSTI